MECYVCEQPALHPCSICGAWLCAEHAELCTIPFKDARVRTYVCSDDDECLTRGLKKALAK